MVLQLVLACVPHLLSSGDDSVDTGSVWVPPENTWPVCATPPDSLMSEPTGWNVGDLVPDFRLVDQYGDTVAMWQFHGCATIIDLSTMWCGPCRELATEVDEITAQYADQGFVYLTFLSETEGGDVPGVEDLVEWAESYGVSQPILSEDQGYSNAITGGSYPRILAVDRSLHIDNDQVTTTRAVIESTIEGLLAE